MPQQYIVYTVYVGGGCLEIYYTDQSIEEFNAVYSNIDFISYVTIVTSEQPPKKLLNGKEVDIEYHRVP